MTGPEAARFMRALADHLPAMITYWDSDLKCRFANANHGGWFGRSSEEMIGVSIVDYMGESLFQKNEAFIRGALAGERQTFERKVRKPSGEEHHIRAQYIPNMDPDAGVVGFYAFVTDVSAQKEIEERLTAANDLLQEAHAAAEAAARTKSAFLSNMSHELRNPLTSIIGFAELLAHGFEAAGLPAQVSADDSCIRQILTNLIGNAVKFTATGQVTLRAAYDERARVLRFEVADTGPGIPVERQPQLFQRFSQIDGSMARAFGGTGLGLAISKGLAEAMQGQVGVSSAPGEGSCFWVEVPCEPVEPGAIGASPSAVS